jgi:hypothetical protein
MISLSGYVVNIIRKNICVSKDRILERIEHMLDPDIDGDVILNYNLKENILDLLNSVSMGSTVGDFGCHQTAQNIKTPKNMHVICER